MSEISPLRIPGLIRSNLGIFCAVAFVVLLFSAIDLRTPMGTDYGVYFSNGWFMSQGLLPYVDFWTHKAPLLVMALSGWILVFGSELASAVVFNILLTILASLAAYLLALKLELGRRAAAVSALIFAFFTSSHLVDPTRNGIIIVLAAGLEMFALASLIAGIRRSKRFPLILSGVLVVLAAATRQTSAVAYFAMLAAVFAFGRASGIRKLATDAVYLTVGCLAGTTAFLLYFLFEGVPLSIVWDQLYTFNIAYATGYKIKMTWWISGWVDLISPHQLHILLFGVCAYLLTVMRKLIRREHLAAHEIILPTLLLLHGFATYASQKINAMYFFQALPEASIMTGLVIVGALTPADKEHERSPAGRTFVVAVLLVLTLLCLKSEALYTLDRVQKAGEGGYLAKIGNLPEYIVAREIQKLAPIEGDRIWIFGASSDEVYPFAQRLPAISFTNTSRLVYVLSPHDFTSWYEQFMRGKPKVVICYYDQAYMDRYKSNPVDEASGRSAENILKIRELIVSKMKKIDYELTFPELYVWDEKGIPTQ